MFIMYLLAIIPMIVGTIVWIISKKVNWIEWICGMAAAILLSIIFHICIVHGMTSDIETWSGNVENVNYTPKWRAEWTETETYEDSEGDTHTRIVNKSRDYPPVWTVNTNIGKYDINENEYNVLKLRFGKEISAPGYRPHFDSGDKNDYSLVNINNWYQPMHVTKNWSNKIKACPSVFSFPTISNDSKAYDYPENNNLFMSDRLLGEAKSLINVYNFDCMNARLGPAKKVNVIIIVYASDCDNQVAQEQEAKWIGGKKNDLVLCCGDFPSKWSYVFGWTDETLVKRNLETILLLNNVDNKILPLIENEIIKNYNIKDWHQFDYLTIDPPTWSYIVLLITMIITQGILWVFFHFNNYNKILIS